MMIIFWIECDLLTFRYVTDKNDNQVYALIMTLLCVSNSSIPANQHHAYAQNFVKKLKEEQNRKQVPLAPDINEPVPMRQR